MKIAKNIKKIFSLVFLIILIFVFQYIVLNKFLKDNEKNHDVANLYGNISFVSNRTDKREKLNELIEEFEKIHPNVNVKLELIGDAEEILERKASVGEMADVTLVPSVIERREYHKYFLPIDDLGFDKESMYDYSSGLGSDKSLYTLTTSQSWHGVIYNKQIFEKLGITKLPTTENEFFSVCDKIKNNDIIPVALNYRQSWIMSMWLDTIPYLYNIDLEGEVLLNKKDILGDESAIYKSITFARKIYTNEYCEQNPLDYDWRQCKEDIADGKIAMIIWNSDFVYQLEDLGFSEDSIGMFPLPHTNTIHMTGDYKMAVSKNTKYPDVAKEFLKYLFEEDRYAKAVNVMSNSKESKRTKEMLKNLEKFNLPIKFQEDVIINQNDKNVRIHQKYHNLKNNLGLNYNFVQSYITTQNPEKLIQDMNNKWREQIEN